MENFSYHVPFYVVTGGIDLSGYSSELSAGQVGLFDRATFSVATGAGNGKEFFFAQGHNGGKDWYGQPVTESHKSPFFYGKDVENIYLSKPHTLQNEEWVIGYNGGPSSKSLSFEAGKAVRVKFYFHGQPTYRFFGGPKEYVVSYTPPVDCSEPCNGDDCPEAIGDCLTHTQALIDAINNHIELQKFGVKAKLVNSPYVAGTMNMSKWTLSLCDNGNLTALQAVQAQAPIGVTVERISRSGSISTYEFCQLSTATDPADFAQTGAVLQAVCGECPPDSTLFVEKDVYLVRRPLAPTDSLVDATARDNYADAVGTAYATATSTTIGDGNKTFVGVDGSVAIVELAFTAGTVVSALAADVVEFSRTQAAECVFDDPAAIEWVEETEAGISSSRTLRISNVNRTECSAGDRLDELESILAGVQGINIGTLTKIAGTACADDYTVTQNSQDCLPEACLTNNVTFTYDELPSFENNSWVVVPPVVSEDDTRKCGIRVTAGYVDPKNGNCTFDITSYYEVEPIKFELSLLQEDGSNCDFAQLPTVHQSQFGRVSRQSGEYVIREVIMKDAAYLRHIAQYSDDPLMRERFQVTVVERVDRTAFYNLYYVTYKASYGNSFRKNEQEKFTTVFAFKEGDAAAKVFEDQIIKVLEAKSGDVVMHINE